MRENYYRDGDVCSVKGCEFPVFWTAEQVCLEHVRHPAPAEDPNPPASAIAGKTKTPKE